MDPETTVAVSVITVPEATDVTSVPELVMASDVVVGAAAAHACGRLRAIQTASKNSVYRRKRDGRPRWEEPCVAGIILASGLAKGPKNMLVGEGNRRRAESE